MISLAFSPCPNDIFLFHRIILDSEKTPFSIGSFRIIDIHELNQVALSRTYDIVKISASLYPKIQDYYDLLSVGHTLGYGCGPLLVYNPNSPSTITGSPSHLSTAHALCSYFFPDLVTTQMRYDQILPLLQLGNIQRGLLIHEERFSIPSSLCVERDIGQLWHQHTSLPLPLGCIAVAKHLPDHTKALLTEYLQESLSQSLAYPSHVMQLAKHYAQTSSDLIIQQFINTYVSRDTMIISRQGMLALQKLWDLTSSPHPHGH